MTLEIENNILVFKTNVKSDLEFLKIKAILDTNNSIEEWSIDREDKDCVLRIKSNVITENKVIALFLDAGFFCEELND
jgi:hypothetical protein